MRRRISIEIRIMALALAVGVLAPTTLAAAPSGRCQSLQARCALQVGGTCNPVTGRWHVPGYLVASKNACLSAGLAQKPTR